MRQVQRQSKTGCKSQENRTALGRSLHTSSNRRTLRGANLQDQAKSMGAVPTEQGGVCWGIQVGGVGLIVF